MRASTRERGHERSATAPGEMRETGEGSILSPAGIRVVTEIGAIE
jgi:hypothetical protein